MAEPLPTLIKLAESKVERVQRAIAELMRGVGDLDAAVARLQGQMTKGGEVAREEDLAAIYQQAGAFVMRVKREQEAMMSLKAELLAEVETRRRELATHFAEQKRYEVLWARKQAALKRAHDAKQQAALDEVAGVQDWLRRQP